MHDHSHAPNRFAVVPTSVRLNADPQFTGKGVTIAFLDSGFYPHPDLSDRILFYQDISGERASLDVNATTESWQWHGTQTSVVAAGNGHLSDGVYAGLARNAQVVLVKVSANGRITEENIARGIKWVIANRKRFDIRVLNISLGGDEDVSCTKSIIDQAAEEAVRTGIVVVAAAGNSGADGKHSIPPANSPSVITVGGYHDNNQPDGGSLDLYHSNFRPTADGTVKPEIVAPAMWVAAPILPGTDFYVQAETLSADRDNDLREMKIVATHYQHVDGTSFAAPIVTSIVAQMIEANPRLTPGVVRNILTSTADRIAGAPAMRQGFGVVNASRAVKLAQKEEHALNTVGCSPPRVLDGHLVFVYHDDEARKVSLAGDFNGWNTASHPLTKDTGGLWLCRLATPGPGCYQYKFVVDDRRWAEDPSNGMKMSDGFDGLNSLLVIR